VRSGTLTGPIPPKSPGPQPESAYMFRIGRGVEAWPVIRPGAPAFRRRGRRRALAVRSRRTCSAPAGRGLTPTAPGGPGGPRGPGGPGACRRRTTPGSPLRMPLIAESCPPFPSKGVRSDCQKRSRRARHVASRSDERLIIVRRVADPTPPGWFRAGHPRGGPGRFRESHFHWPARVTRPPLFPSRGQRRHRITQDVPPRAQVMIGRARGALVRHGLREERHWKTHDRWIN
jgi:hypothetical protein